MKMIHFGIVKSKIGAASLSNGQTNRRGIAHLLLFIVHKEKINPYLQSLLRF